MFSHFSEFWACKRKFSHTASSFLLFCWSFPMALKPSHASNLRSPAVFLYCISTTVLHLNHRLSRLRVSIFWVNLSTLNLEIETLLRNCWFHVRGAYTFQLIGFFSVKGIESCGSQLTLVCKKIYLQLRYHRITLLTVFFHFWGQLYWWPHHECFVIIII